MMNRSKVLATAIVAATIALPLASETIAPPVSAWAEESPPISETEEPVVPPSEEPAPDPTEEPSTSVPPILEEPVNTPVDNEPPAAPAQPPSEEPAMTTDPAQEFSGGSSRYVSGRETQQEGVAPAAIPSPAPEGPASPVTPTPNTATPTPSSTPKVGLDLEKVEYANPSEGSGSAPLAVVALIGSLTLILMLGLGKLYYRTRVAHRTRPRAFPRR